VLSCLGTDIEWLHRILLFPSFGSSSRGYCKKDYSRIRYHDEGIDRPCLVILPIVGVSTVFFLFQQSISQVSFVVDFVLCADNKPSTTATAASTPATDVDDPFSHLRVIIIELNPLAEFAGTGLFSWVTDKPV
jgi:hypothetical protein